jgi:DNA polymerase-3 subunit beta
MESNRMKATCNREGLLSAFQLANVAVPTRDVKPILKNIKAIAGQDCCTLMATDLELGIRLDVRNLRVDQPGEGIFPAAKLLAILRESQDEELVIEANTDACTVRGEHVEFEMPSEDPANFPDLPTFEDDKHHSIAAGELREMIRRTVFATADDVGRYSMTGVLWELEEEQARLVATDGRRLALAIGPAKPHGGHVSKGMLPVVPTKAMTLLERNLTDDEQQVQIGLRPNEALFRAGHAVIYSRLVEGRFPDYRQVLPKKQTAKVALNVPAFTTAVRQAAIMTDDESKRVVFHFARNKLTLQAQGATTGRSKVEMPLEYDNKNLDISFNPAFLIDMLRVLPPDAELMVELIDGSSPALFRSGPHYMYLVMPLT